MERVFDADIWREVTGGERCDSLESAVQRAAIRQSRSTSSFG